MYFPHFCTSALTDIQNRRANSLWKKQTTVLHLAPQWICSLSTSLNWEWSLQHRVSAQPLLLNTPETEERQTDSRIFSLISCVPNFKHNNRSHLWEVRCKDSLFLSWWRKNRKRHKGDKKQTWFVPVCRVLSVSLLHLVLRCSGMCTSACERVFSQCELEWSVSGWVWMCTR